jgi:2-polyprenyl-3-methyl-5-hydroxy-6-metoxy-1,4-benzoquinol methylase
VARVARLSFIEVYVYLTYGGAFNRARQTYFNKIIKRLALSPGARVLDYGCGPGDFILCARQNGIDAIGIDSSPRSVRLARERGISVMAGGTAELLARPDRYDAILAQSVLEHVADAVRLVTDLRSVLSPGGILVLSSPTPGPFFWDDPTHVRPHTPKSITVLAELADMRCEYLSYVFAFLLGMELRLPIFFQILNALPVSLGSNLISFLRKPD